MELLLQLFSRLPFVHEMDTSHNSKQNQDTHGKSDEKKEQELTPAGEPVCFEPKEFCDFTISVGEHFQARVHKIFLAKSSKYFHTLFSNDKNATEATFPSTASVRLLSKLCWLLGFWSTEPHKCVLLCCCSRLAIST